MKKVIIFTVVFSLLFSGVLFAGDNDDQIRSHFKSTHATTATIMDVQEAAFMDSARRLTEGAYYIIHPSINQYVPTSNIIALRSPDYQTWINAYIYELYRWLKVDTPVYVLVRYSKGEYYKFHVVEILQR